MNGPLTRRFSYSLVLSLVAGCSSPTDVEDVSLFSNAPAFSLEPGFGGAACGGSGSANINPDGVDRTCLTTGDDIKFTYAGVASTLDYKIGPAMASWNGYFEQQNGFPQFKVVTQGGIPLNVHGVDPNDEYCGETPSGSGGRVASLNLYQATDPFCAEKGTGTFRQILVHELGHAAGWNGQHGGAPDNINPENEGCAVFIDIPNRPLASSPCYHDVEALFRAQASSSGYFPPPSYYTSSILYQTDASATSVPVGETAEVSVDLLVGTHGHQYVVTANTFQWTSSDFSVFMVPSPGHVHGVAEDTARVVIKYQNSGDPAGFLIWSPLKTRGDRVLITVTPAPPPPPPPPFKVDSIWADQMPITVAQWTTIRARVVSPPGSPYSIRWIVTDSRTPSLSDTLINVGDQMDVNVTPASYTLTFRARPQYGTTTGIEFSQSIPVCTGAGAFLSSASSPSAGEKQGGKPGGPIPNAVGGC